MGTKEQQQLKLARQGDRWLKCGGNPKKHARRDKLAVVKNKDAIKRITRLVSTLVHEGLLKPDSVFVNYPERMTYPIEDKLRIELGKHRIAQGAKEINIYQDPVADVRLVELEQERVEKKEAAKFRTIRRHREM